MMFDIMFLLSFDTDYIGWKYQTFLVSCNCTASQDSDTSDDAP